MNTPVKKFQEVNINNEDSGMALIRDIRQLGIRLEQ